MSSSIRASCQCGISALFLLLFNFANGQVDTVVLLPETEVVSSAIKTNPVGTTIQSFDSSQIYPDRSLSLADLLRKNSNIFIKSYGSGSLATISIRGGNAAHTAINWNGLSVQNPMLALQDFSLIPISFVDEVEVQFGGNSVGWGSGAIGGTIQLINKPNFDKKMGLKIGSSIGSFGWSNQYLNLEIGSDKFLSRTRLFNQNANNEFSYRIRENLPKKKQVNNATHQEGLMQEMYWSIKPNTIISSSLWLQNANRQIPPTTTQNKSEASQTDKIFRVSAQLKTTGTHFTWEYRSGFFNENNGFVDPLIGLNTNNEFWTLVNDLEVQWHSGKSTSIAFGANHNFITASSESYSQKERQTRLAFYLSFKHRYKRLSIQLASRQEWVDNNNIPIVPSFGIQYALKNNQILKAKISRNYRLPGINDLYWKPGGNKDLKPERGWSEEISFTGKIVEKKWGLDYTLTLFNRNIDDWIIWSIRAGNFFYEANNIAKVWSRGVEYRMQWQSKKVAFRIGYDYIRSSSQISIEQPKITKGQQLIYTPQSQLNSGFSYKLNNWSLQYDHQYSGMVHTLNEDLEAYQISNFQLQYEYTIKPFKGSVFFQINNLWNANYRIIERRPMPGRYIRTGLNLTY